MKLKILGQNQTEIWLKDKIILFSYNTPVAYYVKKTGRYFKTDKKWSNTTQKHISTWLGDISYTILTQSDINRIGDNI